MGEHVESSDLEKGTRYGELNDGNGAPLQRATTTLTLSNEQYERLFFQPSAPRRGDLAKRFGMSFLYRTDYRTTDTDSLQPIRPCSACLVSSSHTRRPSSHYANFKAQCHRTRSWD